MVLAVMSYGWLSRKCLCYILSTDVIDERSRKHSVFAIKIGREEQERFYLYVKQMFQIYSG